ncbi:MAG: NUDIX domain-containing protein, partial [Saprospiraceae bacterium]|nr:NUDIX domain-containing protein [Saprospiraceae bacterium]
TDRFDKVIIHFKDFNKLKADFKSLFKIIHAAGGIVKNEFEEILLIKRLGKLDLPKGKLEKDEKKKVAAIREVEEETGIQKVILTHKIAKMRHTYRHKKGFRVLKLTHWYAMEAPKQDTKPQKSENITDVFWTSVSAVKAINDLTYASIQDILNQYLKDQRFD